MVWGTAVVGMLTIGIVLIKTEASASRGGNGGSPRRRQFGGLGMGGSNGQISYASHVDLSEEQLAVRLQLVNRCTEDITHRLPTWLDADRRSLDGHEEQEDMTCSLCFDPMWCHQGTGTGTGGGGGGGGNGSLRTRLGDSGRIEPAAALHGRTIDRQARGGSKHVVQGGMQDEQTDV